VEDVLSICCEVSLDAQLELNSFETGNIQDVPIRAQDLIF